VSLTKLESSPTLGVEAAPTKNQVPALNTPADIDKGEVVLKIPVLLATVAFCLIPSCFFAQSNVTTWRYDINRTGQNTAEVQLGPANVNNASFGKLRSYGVDGYVYAQPLYVAHLNTPAGMHNVVFIATEHDSIYALDADGNQQLWKASLIDTAHGAGSGATTVPSADVGTHDIVPEVGITGTPVIDASSNTIYVVAKSKENGACVQRLHALDLTTGNEKPGSPVAITGSVPGTGEGSVGGIVSFVPLLGLERVGMLLLNGHVYFAMASHGDNGPYHGWVFAYDAVTLQQTGIYNTSPNGGENGIWESGAGLAADVTASAGRLFFPNGNGTFSASTPYANTMDFGNAVERLDLSNGGLQVTDEWTPFDQATLNASDTDQGSGGILILPDQPGSHPHELVQVGKNGRIEILDRDNLGGFNTTSNQIAQEISGQIGGLWSTPAYWNGSVYFWGNNDTLKQFRLANGQLSQAPSADSQIYSGFPGASPVVTSSGTESGVLWAIRSDGYGNNGAAVLYAFDAADVSKLLYSSNQNGLRDSAGPAVKFTVPLVIDGQVFVGAQNEVDVYGELIKVALLTPTPVFSPASGAYAIPQQVTLSDNFPDAAVYYTTDGTTPTTASARYDTPISVGTTLTIQALAVSATGQSSMAIGTYTIGTQPTINFANGFTSVAGLTLNGSVTHSDDSRIQLTNGGAFQAGSFFWSAPVNVQRFDNDFTFQLSGIAPIADGITFTIQNSSPYALGSNGGGLGYGPDQPGGPQGIQKSVALKFDTYNNAGEGTDSTGLVFNGDSPTIPAIDLTGWNILLGNGDTIAVHEHYDGQTLVVMLKDTVTGASVSGQMSGDISQILGGTTAYVGFTGGTGGLTASQKILTWTFTSNP